MSAYGFKNESYWERFQGSAEMCSIIFPVYIGNGGILNAYPYKWLRLRLLIRLLPRRAAYFHAWHGDQTAAVAGATKLRNGLIPFSKPWLWLWLRLMHRPPVRSSVPQVYTLSMDPKQEAISSSRSFEKTLYWSGHAFYFHRKHWLYLHWFWLYSNEVDTPQGSILGPLSMRNLMQKACAEDVSLI